MILIFCISSAAWATEPEYIPDIHVGPALIERSDTVSTLDSLRIEKAYAQSSDDILRTVPGVAAARSGGPGQPSFIYIRGADSEGTLVLLDGLPLNDPSLSNQAFDFSLLDLDSIERIEVWKGPQSVRFGSGATGGVINIVSKKGRGPLAVKLGVEGGSYQSLKTKAAAQGSMGEFSYALSATRMGSVGISAADETLGNSERDGSSINTLSSHFSWAPDRRNEIEFSGRYSDKYADLDYAPSNSAPFVFADATNYHMHGNSLALSLSGRHQWRPGLESSLSAMRFSQLRNYANDPQTGNPAWLRAKYVGEFYRLENLNSWKPFAGLELTFGPTADFENASSDYLSSSSSSAEAPRKSSAMTGAMTSVHLDQRYYFLSGGARFDSHNRYGAETAFELAPGVHLNADMDLGARFATAYKAPTIFELYDPKTGNVDLQPERVQGYEVALTRFFEARKSRVQISLFKNEFRNLIQFGASSFNNVGSAFAEGAEFEGRKDFGWFNLQFGYTYLETRDNRGGLQLQRRPRNNLSARAEVRPSDSFALSLDFLGVDRREDLSPVTSQATTTPSYQVLNGTVEWQASPALKTYARVLNLFDRKYQEVAGYGTYRRSVFIGLIYGL